MNKKSREEVYHKYDGHCAYCGKVITIKEMEVDHMLPKALSWWFRYPEIYSKYTPMAPSLSHIDNLMPSCKRCNHYKRSHHLEGFRKLMMTLHKRVMDVYIAKVARDFGIITVQPWDGIFYFETFMRRTRRNPKQNCII